MVSLKTLLFIFIISVLTMSFSQCNDTSKLETKPPLELGSVYYKTWVAGVRGGGSGINLFIPIKSHSKKIVLDSVYFMDKIAKLEPIGDTLVVGRFKTQTNQPKDIIMSNEPFGEYGNKIPEIKPKLPFELNPNECIVSYVSNNKIRYFKIGNIIKKEEIHQFPSIKPQ